MKITLVFAQNYDISYYVTTKAAFKRSSVIGKEKTLVKKACKRSEDTQIAGYAWFEKELAELDNFKKINLHSHRKFLIFYL